MNEQAMDEFTEEFIEILELEEDDDQDPDAVRKTFRIPIRDKDRYAIIINGTKFPIEDINAKGAGILMVKDHSFARGMLLAGCELLLGDSRFPDVDCEIVHITSIKGEPPLFGVKWSDTNLTKAEDFQNQLAGVCESLKKEMLDKGRDDIQDNSDTQDDSDKNSNSID
ncbi:hypothetical protein MTBBW1_300027 [Desulfamplus magnetovallimortis]|uniref:PilZ domain-containing protein n=1 Tax=Desulfamplus magnetovallimortis TaxID=1246637 RepID=A0A1W1HFT9_9BACT|nr:hypothetical protein [Desulfamplus magnetovallimortis]SLM31296.1 hypothetical protein MTBBW1_300027 [Desulfamplus magnetovallimortis]